MRILQHRQLRAGFVTGAMALSLAGCTLLGYEKLIELPVLPVQDRADAIEHYLSGRELTAAEGVWTIGNHEYEVAIVPNTLVEFPGYEYVGIVTATSRKAWKRGETKLLLKRTAAPTVFAGLYLLGNGSRYETSFLLAQPDVLATRVPSGSNAGMEEVLLVRVYPADQPKPATPGTHTGAITSTGFGFLIAPQILATNYHLVADAKTVSVEIGPTRLKGELLLRDPPNDLALLRVQGTRGETAGHGMICLVMGDSDSLQVGDTVFTIIAGPGYSSQDTWRTVEGTVTSLLGPQEDPRTFEVRFSTPPDSAGAPLLGRDGRVLGILASARDDEFLRLPQETRARPVTLAVKSTYLRSLLVLVKDVRCAAQHTNGPPTSPTGAPPPQSVAAVARIQASR